MYQSSHVSSGARLLLSCVVHAIMASQLPDELLREAIIASGNPRRRPVLNPLEPVEVQMCLWPAGLSDIREKEGHVKLGVSILEFWKNEPAAWDPMMYHGLTFSSMTRGDVWVRRHY